MKEESGPNIWNLFCEWQKKESLANKIFFALFLLGLIVFSVNLVFLPETSFQDASLYLNKTIALLNGEELVGAFNFKPILMAMFFGLTGLSVIGFSKVFPLIIFVVSVLALYWLARQLCFRHRFLPLALFANSYWVTNFFSLNYNGPLVACFVLLYASVFLWILRSREKKLLPLAFMVLFLLPVFCSLTKMSGLVLSVPMLLFGAWLVKEKSGIGLKKLWGSLLVILFVLFGVILFFSEKLQDVLGWVEPTLKLFVFRLLTEPFSYVVHLVFVYLRLFNYPPNECLNIVWFGGLVDFTKLVFVVMTLPLAIVFVSSTLRAIDSRKKNLFLLMVSGLVVTNFLIIVLEYLPLATFVLPRYLIPTIALSCLLFGVGYGFLKNNYKKLVVISLIVFCVYSAGYGLVSTNHHYNNWVAHEPSLGFVSDLGDVNVLTSFSTEALRLHTGSRVVPFIAETNFYGFNNVVRGNRVNYIYFDCYSERMNKLYLEELLLLDLVSVVYEDSCVTVFKVNGFVFDVLLEPVVVDNSVLVGKEFDVCH